MGPGVLVPAAGGNAFKLKHGFHALFGTSVHRMLTGIRMQKTRELLETGFPVLSVAYKVGCRHPASFSTAFAQYYGCSKIGKGRVPNGRAWDYSLRKLVGFAQPVSNNSTSPVNRVRDNRARTEVSVAISSASWAWERRWTMTLPVFGKKYTLRG